RHPRSPTHRAAARISFGFLIEKCQDGVGGLELLKQAFQILRLAQSGEKISAVTGPRSGIGDARLMHRHKPIVPLCRAAAEWIDKEIAAAQRLAFGNGDGIAEIL